MNTGTRYVVGLALLGLLAVQGAPSRAGGSVNEPGPGLIAECLPCTFRISPDTAEMSFRFEEVRQDGERTIKAILVSAGTSDSVLQRLPVEGMDPVSDKAKVFFGAQDINFDGHLDLVLGIRMGVVNTVATYWLFDAAKRQFGLLGSYPVFKVDAERKRLSNYVRGGHGGMIYESNEYEFHAGKLRTTRVEKQTAAKTKGTYRLVIKERRNGVMRTTKIETKRPE